MSHHPKLCLFLGASVVEPLSVVTELMAGSVRGLLDAAASSASSSSSSSSPPLPWRRRVEALLDASLAMAFLHGMRVVHRDMKVRTLSPYTLSPDLHTSPHISLAHRHAHLSY